MTTAREVLDLQADLAERLDEGQLLAEYLNRLAEAQGLVGRRTGGIAPLVFEHVLSGRAFRIAANMNPEIVYRAWDQEHSIPPSMRISELAPPRHRGFAYLEEPIRYTDTLGVGYPVSAFTWGYSLGAGGEKGYLISVWGDITVESEGPIRIPGFSSDEFWTPAAHMDVLGRWFPIAAFWGPVNGMAGNAHAELSREELDEMGISGSDPATSIVAAGRSILALWQLLRETVDTPEHHVETVPTEGRKRVAGRHVRPDVNVIALRRPSRPTMRPGTGKKREFRSWVEGGYTQTFWTGPGRTIPVTKTIGGHWSVLDEDLPIKNRPTVFDLRR